MCCSQAALKCTDSQEQDMLHLRHLFYAKLGQLARQRGALLRKVPDAGSELQHTKAVTFNHGYRHVADKLVETTEVAEQLCANRYEETQVYMYCSFCLFRCVSLFMPCPGHFCVILLLFSTKMAAAQPAPYLHMHSNLCMSAECVVMSRQQHICQHQKRMISHRCGQVRAHVCSCI